MPKVVVSAFSLDERAEQILQSAVEQLGEEDVIKASHNIVIKPNLCCDKSSRSGATSDVSLVDALVSVLTNMNSSARISIVESNNASINASEAFELLGYSELAKHRNVTLVNLSNDKKRYVSIEGHILDNLLIPQTLFDMDYFVSVAKMKTNIIDRMSGVLKNQFGCLTARNKTRFHPFLSEVITDLYNVFRPNMCVVDGCPGMEGFGPTDGIPVDTGLLVVGNDAIATDCVIAEMMGFSSKSVPHLKFALKHSHENTKENDEKIETIKNCTADPANFEFVPFFAYRMSRCALALQRLAQYLINVGSLMEKMRSASSSVGLRSVKRRVDYEFAMKYAWNWVFKKNG